MSATKKFVSDQSGAITVDWVVLTAAVIGLMFAALTVFFNGITGHADQTADFIASREIGDGF